MKEATKKLNNVSKEPKNPTPGFVTKPIRKVSNSIEDAETLPEAVDASLKETPKKLQKMLKEPKKSSPDFVTKIIRKLSTPIADVETLPGAVDSASKKAPKKLQNLFKESKKSIPKSNVKKEEQTTSEESEKLKDFFDDPSIKVKQENRLNKEHKQKILENSSTDAD